MFGETSYSAVTIAILHIVDSDFRTQNSIVIDVKKYDARRRQNKLTTILGRQRLVDSERMLGNNDLDQLKLHDPSFLVEIISYGMRNL